MSNFLKTILYEIAKDLNKPTDSVEKFIDILTDNWYDTPEALLQIDDE
jgi:hypothetical protein